MKKFAVFSGFLGAGKTSLLIALTRYYSDHIAPAAMLSNDLGADVTLADHRLAALSGVRSDEITGECICFCRDVLAARLDAFYAAGCELVCSDIPGFGVGALEHVYHGLAAEQPGRYDLAPFTVVIEPAGAEALLSGADGDLDLIRRAQLREADLIALNKSDLRSGAETAKLADGLAREFPAARVLTVSARTGAGLDALARALRDGAASLRRPVFDVDDAALGAAMDTLSEYYLQYRAVVCCDTFDGTAYLEAVARAVQADFAAARRAIPHLKLLAWTAEGDFGKVDLLGADRPIEITRPFARPCADVAVVLNASAACAADDLDKSVTGAAERAAADFRLETQIFRKDVFCLGE